MNYYKIIVDDGELGAAYEYVSAKDENELKDRIQDFLTDFDHKSPVTVIEVDIKECLQEEEDFLEHRLFSEYFKKHYDVDTITIREYSKLKKRFQEDLEFRWQVLREINSEERKG